MATTRSSSEGILSDDKAEQREKVVELLKKAYWMEIETVMSYIANSVNPDGVRAQEIIESLRDDVQEELGHAQQFANRIIEFTEGLDWVSQDMVIEILHDEEGHRRLFEGFLREYEAEGLAESPG